MWQYEAERVGGWPNGFTGLPETVQARLKAASRCLDACCRAVTELTTPPVDTSYARARTLGLLPFEVLPGARDMRVSHPVKNIDGETIVNGLVVLWFTVDGSAERVLEHYELALRQRGLTVERQGESLSTRPPKDSSAPADGARDYQVRAKAGRSGVDVAISWNNVKEGPLQNAHP